MVHMFNGSNVIAYVTKITHFIHTRILVYGYIKLILSFDSQH